MYSTGTMTWSHCPVCGEPLTTTGMGCPTHGTPRITGPTVTITPGICADCERLTRERDKARAELAAARQLWAVELEAAQKQRDEARMALDGMVAPEELRQWKAEAERLRDIVEQITAERTVVIEAATAKAERERDRALALLREVRGNYPNGIRAALLARLDAMLFGKDGAK